MAWGLYVQLEWLVTEAQGSTCLYLPSATPRFLCSAEAQTLVLMWQTLHALSIHSIRPKKVMVHRALLGTMSSYSYMHSAAYMNNETS